VIDRNWRDNEFDEVEELSRELRLILDNLGRIESLGGNIVGPAQNDNFKGADL